MSKVIMVTGGSRSGKSVIAEKKAREYGDQSVLYLATAIPVDEDMKERIRIHQERRDVNWGTYEGYRDLGQVVTSTEKSTILLDCVTVMITNILFEEERDFDKISNQEISDLENEVILELSKLIKGIRDTDKTLIIVTNEVMVVCSLFGIAFLWDWNENCPFPVLWPLLSFSNLLAY